MTLLSINGFLSRLAASGQRPFWNGVLFSAFSWAFKSIVRLLAPLCGCQEAALQAFGLTLSKSRVISRECCKLPLARPLCEGAGAAFGYLFRLY
jgi:hypothetical protein